MVIKKIFLFLFLGLFLISFASALEFDNVLEYDEETKEAYIFNCDIWVGICLNRGELIGKAKLNTPLNVRVPRGYQKVAEFDIWAFQDYSDALKQFTFKDLKGKQQINRDYDLKMLEYEDVIIQDYITSCEDVWNETNQNITSQCSQIQNGTHLEQKEKWTKISPADLKKNDVLTIGVFTDVQAGDYVDWIPMIYGVEVPQWATWTEDLNVGLVSYQKLDGTGSLTIDSLGTYNGTVVNTTQGVTGKINKSYEFEGPAGLGEVDFGTTLFATEDEITVSFWLNADTITANDWLVGRWGGGEQFLIRFDGADKIEVYVSGTGGIVGPIYSASAVSTGSWHHVVVTYDSTNGLVLYLDTANTGTAANGNFLNVASRPLPIGSQRNTGNYFDGKMDEIGFWNRSLTSSEVTQLYNDGDGITYQATFGPTINITYPLNITYSGAITELNYTNSSDAVDCWYSDDGGVTNSSIVTCGTNFNPTAMGGFNTWTVYGNTSTGDVGSDSVTFFVNNTVITQLLIPTDGSNSTVSFTYFNFTSTPVNTNLTNATLYLWNGTDDSLLLTNFTTLSGSVAVNTSFTNNLSEGVYIWNAETCGIGVDCQFASNNSFVIHTTAPTANITAPTGVIDFIEPNGNLTLVYNFSEPGQNLSEHLEECWYVYPDVEDYECYQESTNTTNQSGIDGTCNLDYTGSYAFIDNATEWSNPEKIIDGDFSTTGAPTTNGTLIINYTIPEGVLNATWKIGWGSPTEGINLTIPQECLSFETLQLRWDKSSFVSNPDYDCYNGTSWITLSDTNDFSLFEEAIIWDFKQDLNCSANETNFTYISDQDSISIYARDTFGLIATDTSSWDVLFKHWTIDYTTPQYEATQGLFVLNTSLLDGETIESAVFSYNGTNYTTSFIVFNGNYLITSSILLPSVENDTNFTFSFYVVVDSVTYNFLEETQEIQNINFVNCTDPDDLLLNVSLFDEREKTPLLGEIEFNIQIYSKTSDDVVSELNATYENTTNQEICLTPSAAFSSLYMNAEFRYSSDGYVPEFYHIQNADLTDYPRNLSLFDLNSSFSTEFSVTYKNNAFIFTEGAVIQLQRKYIGEDLYETVEAPVTGNGGEAILHIDLNTNKYRASVVKDGEVLDFFENIVFSCTNELSGDCTHSLDGTVDPNNDVPIEDITDFAYSVSIDEDNQTVTVLFAVPSGTPSTINVLLNQIDMFGNLTSCNTTIVTSAGSITCDYTDTIEKSILELSISKDNVELAVLSFVNDPELDMDGMNFFIVFLFMISLVGMAIASPEWMIIISVMILLISGTLLLLKGMSLVMGLGAIAWVVVAAAIIIFKMAKQEDR